MAKVSCEEKTNTLEFAIKLGMDASPKVKEAVPRGLTNMKSINGHANNA